MVNKNSQKKKSSQKKVKRPSKKYEAKVSGRKNVYGESTVTIFSSVSNETPTEFKNLCSDLGFRLSKHGFKISYGSSPNGCNKWLVDGAEKAPLSNFRAVGYQEWAIDERMEKPPKNMKTEIVMTKGNDLHERITELKKNSIAVVCLPGGPATLEELWNSIVGVAELNPIPVIIFNINNFYDDTIRQINKMAEYFYWPKYKNYIIEVKTIDELIPILDAFNYLNKMKIDR